VDKREEFNAALKEAMKTQDQTALSTIRLMLAALKDRDITARSSGKAEGVDDSEILSMLQSMIKQRREYRIGPNFNAKCVSPFWIQPVLHCRKSASRDTGALFFNQTVSEQLRDDIGCRLGGQSQRTSDFRPAHRACGL